MLSDESVMFLTNLLDAVQLSGNDPHLVETAQAMARARKELDALRSGESASIHAMPENVPEFSSMADSAG